jgi:hypothetical protein
MTIRSLQLKEIAALELRQQKAIDCLSGFKISSETEHLLSMAQLRHLLISKSISEEGSSWALASEIFAGLVSYRRSQMTVKATGLPPAWAGEALCILMEVCMLRTSNFKGISGLNDSLVSQLRTGHRVMSLQHMVKLSSDLGVPVSWFVEPGAHRADATLFGLLGKPVSGGGRQ